MTALGHYQPFKILENRHFSVRYWSIAIVERLAKSPLVGGKFWDH
jgi:hypothetical protein